MSKKEPIKSQLRIPADVHDRLVRASEQSGRSMNAEIVHRLNESFRLSSENQTLSEYATQQRKSARILAPGIMGLVKSLEEKPDGPGGKMKREVLDAMASAANSMAKTGEIDSSQLARWIYKVLLGDFEKAAENFHREQSELAAASHQIGGQDRLQEAAKKIMGPDRKLREAAAKMVEGETTKHAKGRKK